MSDVELRLRHLMEEMPLPKRFSEWQHYKGNVYVVVGFARDEKNAEVVVQYVDKRNIDAWHEEEVIPWTRPLAHWHDVVKTFVDVGVLGEFVDVPRFRPNPDFKSKEFVRLSRDVPGYFLDGGVMKKLERRGRITTKASLTFVEYGDGGIGEYGVIVDGWSGRMLIPLDNAVFLERL